MNALTQRQFFAWAVAIGATTATTAWLVAVAAQYVLADEPMRPRTILTELPYTSSVLAALFVGTLIAAGLVLREKPRLAGLLGGMMILAVALSEGQAIRNRREFSRLGLSMRLILQAGQFVHGEFVGNGRPFPSATPASILHRRDAWGAAACLQTGLTFTSIRRLTDNSSRFFRGTVVVHAKRLSSRSGRAS